MSYCTVLYCDIWCCRARGEDPEAAAAAVPAPSLASLQDKLKAALEKYDVVLMSFDDVRVSVK